MEADTHLTPREVIRDFIEHLDIMFQNPDTGLHELLGSQGEGTAPAVGPVHAQMNTGDASFAEFAN